jgi:hypothetical protein
MAFTDLILKPTRNVPPHKVLSEFRTDFTGLAGKIVKVSSYDPDADTYYSQNDSVGGTFDGVYSNKQIAPFAVTTATLDDSSASVLGITLEGTAVTDANGNKIDGFNKRYADENGFVASGKPVQIATEGTFWYDAKQFTGAQKPAPGSGLASDYDGKLRVVDLANTNASGAVINSDVVIGKVLSSTGIRQQDVLIQLNF